MTTDSSSKSTVKKLKQTEIGEMSHSTTQASPEKSQMPETKRVIRQRRRHRIQQSIVGTREGGREGRRGGGPEEEPRGWGCRETAAGGELLAASRLAGAAAASASAAASFRVQRRGEIEPAPERKVWDQGLKGFPANGCQLEDGEREGRR